MGCAAVPKYDAFGREIGENTLSGLGGDSRVQPPPQSEPQVEPERVTAAPRKQRRERKAGKTPNATLAVPQGAPVSLPGVRRRRGGGLGCLVAFAILAAVVAAPVIGVISFIGDATDAIDDVRDSFDSDAVTLPDAPQPQGDAPAPAGISGNSLIAPSNFSGALDAMSQAAFTRATRIVLRPERVDVTVVTGEEVRDVQIRYDGDVDASDPSPLNAASGVLELPAVDPAAPARLVRGAARRFRVKPSGINYLIADPDGDRHLWRAYFKNGTYVEGDAKGRVVRRFDGGG